jgi:hypothetical protein
MKPAKQFCILVNTLAHRLTGVGADLHAVDVRQTVAARAAPERICCSVLELMPTKR